jgi:hypothetical protein
MTDLLTPRTRRRSLTVSAASAGAAAAATMLGICMALGLVGWFASEAGSHGETTDALRVGADAWLLAHGSHLQLAGATIGAVPLGLTLLCAYVSYRMGRWAGATCSVEDGRAVLAATAVFAVGYGVVAVVTAVLASTASAHPDLARAFLGGVALAAASGGPGLLLGSGRWPAARAAIPVAVRSVLTGAAFGALLMVSASALLVVVALVLDLGAAANVLARLHTDVPGGLLYTVVVAAVAPNAVLLGGSYLLGPGFTVGAGTLVSPTAVALGPVPAFPLLAALPDEGATPSWTIGLVAVPVLLGAAAAALMLRRHPVLEYAQAALRGFGAGALGGVVFAVSTGLAGGSVGPGRMADVGASLSQTVPAGALAMGAGGLLGGVAMAWWLRRGR